MKTFITLLLTLTLSLASTLDNDIRNLVMVTKKENIHKLLPQAEALKYVQFQFTTHIETLSSLHPDYTRVDIKHKYLQEVSRQYNTTIPKLAHVRPSPYHTNLTTTTPVTYNGEVFTFEELVVLKLYHLANDVHTEGMLEDVLINILISDMQTIYNAYDNELVKDTVYLVIDNIKKDM